MFKNLFKQEPPPKDHLKKGMKVMYLGVEWIVTERFWIKYDCKFFTLHRINKNDQLESCSPEYWCELVTPIDTAAVG